MSSISVRRSSYRLRRPNTYDVSVLLQSPVLGWRSLSTLASRSEQRLWQPDFSCPVSASLLHNGSATSHSLVPADCHPRVARTWRILLPRAGSCGTFCMALVSRSLHTSRFHDCGSCVHLTSIYHRPSPLRSGGYRGTDDIRMDAIDVCPLRPCPSSAVQDAERHWHRVRSS